MSTAADLPRHVREWIGGGLFQHVPSSVIVINKDLQVVAANSEFVRMFGEATGKHCYEAYKKRNRPCTECMAAETFEDGEVRISDTHGVDRRGHPAHYVVHIAPIRNDGGDITHVIEMSYDVTESQLLQRSYNLLFERVPCYVAVIDRDYRVVRANELVRDTFGDRVGTHCYALLKQGQERCRDCPATKTFMDGKVYTSRQLGIDKNGELTAYVVSTAPLAGAGREFEHVIEMAVDVTESEQLSERLLREAQFRHRLTESAIDALVACEATGTINIFNPAAERLFGVEALQVIGRRQLADFLPERFVGTVQEGGSSLHLPETSVVNAQGDELPVRLSGTVLKEGNEVLGAAAFLQDLRDVKRLEREKLDNERLAAVGSTVAQLAHGIKNILTGLEGGMYVIKSGIKRGSTERTNKGWEMLERNVQRITALVQGFLSFSKGHAPRLVPAKPNEIAQEVVDLYRDAAGRAGVTLTHEPQAEMVEVELDAEDIRTCLENLVSNAIDACRASNKEEQIVTLRVSETEHSVVYEVSDNGVGMDCEIKNKVFTTFFSTKGMGGTGLGLLVTRKIVQEHGGRIEMESVPKEGSVFRIILPRHIVPLHGGQARSADRETAKGEGSDGETRG